jgi:hypothetical protein
MGRRVLFTALMLGISANAWGALPLGSAGFVFNPPINNVTINPMTPRSTDSVSVTIKGWKTAGMEVYNDQLQIIGNTIHLDLFWYLPVMTDWSLVSYEYTKSIGTLSPGNYTLEVNYYGSIYATSTALFTVWKPVSDRPGSSLFPWSWFDNLLPH